MTEPKQGVYVPADPYCAVVKFVCRLRSGQSSVRDSNAAVIWHLHLIIQDWS